MLALEETF